MIDPLVDHAIKNVWCNPEQDNQFIVKLHRISPIYGRRQHFVFMGTDVTLPTKADIYHVYNIGQLNPTVVGLLERTPNWATGIWRTFKSTINTNKLFVNLYSASGIEIPKIISHYMFTTNRSLIVAIKDTTNINDNRYLDDLYLRLYTNAYFLSSRADPVNEYIYTDGRVLTSLNNTNEFVTEYQSYAAKEGYTYCFINGLLVDKISLDNTVTGDIVEYVYDSSIKNTYVLKIEDLRLFHSVLDSKSKYVIHPLTAGNGIANDTIDYHDDIDIHIYTKTTDNAFKGLYYNKNVINSHRMITHKDYSICTEYVRYICNEIKKELNSESIANDSFYVQVKIRDAGYKRPLINPSNNITDLYKLSDDGILEMLSSINAQVPIWTATNLENSDYTKIMRCKLEDITPDLVKSAYGRDTLVELFPGYI